MLLIFCLFALNAVSQNPGNYEFRGVWVASVDNIDWPSSKNLSVEAQKAEFIKLLDMHQQNGMNAVIVQIRPAGDALYPSQLEPWSEFLTGKQGQPPIPYYDPLAFMIKETHIRGMEFHACHNTETSSTCCHYLITIIKSYIASFSSHTANWMSKIPEVTECLLLNQVQQLIIC